MENSQKMISIVAPLFNEEAALPRFYQRLCKSLGDLHEYQIEIIFVNDGSTDATREILREHSKHDERVSYINFSRNFGHQASIWAGMVHAIGDCVVTIDADLQDPPELIPEMIKSWERGAEVVATRRTDRASDTTLKRFTAEVFYRLISRVSENNQSRQIGDYRLVSRNVLDQILKIPSGSSYIRGLVNGLDSSKRF